jgi:glycine/D-amino acid oxidase-like deaminating enzyme/nitrite reductase/ring-hydroxylating ferredoxin subunit
MWKSDEGRTVSYWQVSAESGEMESAARGVPADVEVGIIGGGIAGLTTAYLLSKAGVQVAVVDDGPIAGGETARTTAHLTWAIDDRLYRIIDWHGDEHARLAVEAHMQAVDEIEAIVSAENIDCDFSRLDGYLVDAEDPQDDLQKEFSAYHDLGFKEVERPDSVPGESFQPGSAIRFPNHGQFHILRYLNGLIGVIEANGGRILPNTSATEWSSDEGLVIKTTAGNIRCSRAIVLATNYPLQSKMFAKLPAYRTYVIGARVRKGAIPKALIWDTDEPYHYVRLQEETDHDVLIVGGEDHKTGHEDDGNVRFERLWSWTMKHFPAAEEVLYRWSGQVFETHDGLAFIGRYSDSEPNVYLITGDSGMGMTHGTIGGRIVSDLILEKGSRYEAVFDPGRIATQSITEAVPELISSTVPYADWIKGGDVSSVDEIQNGQGAIIQDGVSKIAAYRDDDGKLHKHSAVCTHMGCIVRFNPAERTWDCPCHGSRFRCEDGGVINSPAMSPLGKAE